MKIPLVSAILASIALAQSISDPSLVSIEPGSFTGGPVIDAVIEDSIRTNQIPGAVVLVGHKGRIIHQKAYGMRSNVPNAEPMTLDTIFDVASLTKVVATTSSIMKLVEQGKVRLNERVTLYLPEFQAGRSEITVRQLLTHFSGLRPDVDLEPAWGGYQTGVRLALIDRPTGPAGARFVYSDINFILLGEMVQRLSGKTLPDFAREHIFAPLGMATTMFKPPPFLAGRIAPTEILKDSSEPLRGVVHDMTTRFMGGVAGHAGLFSTAQDLSKFAEMMLGMGKRNSVRVLSPLSVRAATSPQSPIGLPVRGLGWDIDSPLSGPRGDLFPVGSFGHTGFTGTSLWIDPLTQTYVVLLANSGHPHLRPSITPLRGRVANAVAGGLRDVEVARVLYQSRPQRVATAQVRPQPVLTGLDVMLEERFAPLRAKRVGLITNHTGLTRDGKRNIDVMLAAGVNLRVLFSPEHGIAGKEDRENIVHGKDRKTGLPVFSLYSGQNRRPSVQMLRNIDVLVFDIQDVGARFYTYTCTMVNAMEEAARRKIRFIVLDRPNPITGVHVEGPILDPDLKSFVGCIDMPIRHGMTLGELAGMVNAEAQAKTDLHVVPMKNWRREDWFDSLGLTWIDPSPNMRSLNAALLYPGIGMLEAAKVYSVGRGTDAPFEHVGAAWIRGRELADYLNGLAIPGIRVYPTVLRPSASNLAGQTIEGVRFVITSRDEFDSVRFGLELGAALERLFPGKMDWKANEKLVGNRRVLEALSRGVAAQQIEADYLGSLEQFKSRRAQFLLY